MVDIEAFAPVVIPTLCRYEHFKRCVESLARNTHADKTDLYIALDYPAKESHRDGYEKISKYVEEIKGFKTVTIFRREENYGAVRNSKALREYVMAQYDAWIFTEDDNEFSPCFLDFMNKALWLYRDDDKVVSVGGWVHPSFEGVKDKNVIFTYSNSAWGIGIWAWKEKEREQRIGDECFTDILENREKSIKLFKITPAGWHMFYKMMKSGENWDDVKRGITCYLDDRYQVRPYRSLVRNWGNDGSGVHCKRDNGLLQHTSISEDTTFTVEYEAPHCSISKRVLFFNNLPPKSSWRCWAALARDFLVFFKTYIFGWK